MNKYEDDSFESSSSATSMSNEELSNNEAETYKQTEKQNENKDKEEVVHHTLENSLATSENDSLNEEHKWAAVEADERPEFKQLSTFVAFGSMSATSPQHSQRTSEYEHEEKRELEQEKQRNEESDHKSNNANDEKVQNYEKTNTSLENGAVDMHREITSQPRSDVEFSFLSTLEEPLQTLGNRFGEDTTNLPISQKEESDGVKGDTEINDGKKSKTQIVHKEEEEEESDVKPMEKQTEVEQEERKLHEHEEEEKSEENPRKKINAIESEAGQQREDLSISPIINEHRNVNLSKSVSFRLPSLPLPENLHRLKNSINVSDHYDDENYFSRHTKRKTNKQSLQKEFEALPMSLQTILKMQEQPKELQKEIPNRQPEFEHHNNSHADTFEQNKPFESTPSPLPSAKFNFIYPNKHQAGNEQELPLSNNTVDNVNQKQNSSLHHRRHQEQHSSKKLSTTFVSKDDERVLSRAKTLQETSLAVERLVQSLATLRGYNKLQPISTRTQQQSANTTFESSNQSKYNNKAYVSAESEHNVYNYNKSKAKDSVDRLTEEAVLELVLRMLQQEKRTKEMVHASESLHLALRRECHELVTAENFYDKSQYRWYNTSDSAAFTNTNNDDNNSYHTSKSTTELVQHSPSEQRHEPHLLSNGNRLVSVGSVENECSERFLHNHETLYKTIIDSMTKYVFKRVSVFALIEQPSSNNSNIRQQKGKPAHANDINGSHAILPTISPSFCTLLFIDLVLLCKEIADTRLRTLHSLSSPLTNAYEPVLIKYCGYPYSDEAQGVNKFSLERELVTTLIHCLPFEIVQSTLQPWEQEREDMPWESTSLRGKQTRETIHGKNSLVFRLEYWVGFEQMQVVINALLACVRNLLSNCIQQNQYFPLDIQCDAMLESGVNYKNKFHSSSTECVIDPPVQHQPYFVLIESKSKTNNSMFVSEHADHARYGRTKHEVQMAESVHRFPNHINPPQTNMCYNNNSTKNRGSSARNNDINTFGLESIALQKLVLTLSKMTTDMMSDNGAKCEPQQQQEQTRQSEESNANRINKLVHGMSAEEQYALFSSCVMEVITEHIKDVNTIAAISEGINKKYVKRLHKITEEKYSKDNHSKVSGWLRKREKALISKSEVEAANALEQIVQEINVFNASHK